MKNPWENKFKTAIEASTTIQVSKGIDEQRVNCLKPAMIQLKKLNNVKTAAVISSPRYLDLQMTMKILKKTLRSHMFSVGKTCVDLGDLVLTICRNQLAKKKQKVNGSLEQLSFRDLRKQKARLKDRHRFETIDMILCHLRLIFKWMTGTKRMLETRWNSI